VISIPAGTTGAVEDTTHSVSLATGALIDYSINPPATGTGGVYVDFFAIMLQIPSAFTRRRRQLLRIGVR
jgi:hypothetical protein